METLLPHSQLIVDSLIHSPLLMETMGSYEAFDREMLKRVELTEPLNFQQKLGHLLVVLV